MCKSALEGQLPIKDFRDYRDFKRQNYMKIAVIGLGYVGCVAAAKLSIAGHHVIGVDVNPRKVQIINTGSPTVIEPGLDELFLRVNERSKLSSTTDLSAVIDSVEILYICVGTPQMADGDLDMNAIYQVVSEIAQLLRFDSDKKTIIIRSTVKPGTTHKIGEILEGKNVSVVMNPEFIREGKALDDWDKPGLIVIGALDEFGGEVASNLYASLMVPVYFVKPVTAELIKYINNSWHALKVTFGNEIGRLSRTLGVDHEELMDIFLADEKLNISTCYLKPGMPFGGSCLPKDLSALLALAKSQNVSVPVLDAVQLSNLKHLESIIELICSMGKEKIGILGLSFKSGTDDLRNSPSILVMRALEKHGIKIFIHDPNVDLDNLIGQNRDYVQEILPVLTKGFISDLDTMIKQVDVTVVMHDIGAQFELLRKDYPAKVFLNLAKYKV